MARDEYKQLMSDIKEKITAENVQNQNANVDEHSFGGRIGETADLVVEIHLLLSKEFYPIVSIMQYSHLSI